MTPSVDQIIIEKITSYLEPFKGNQQKLRQVLAQGAKIAAAFAGEIGAQFPTENRALIQKCILLELRHRLNDLVDDPKITEKKIQELLHFVEDDVLNSIERAVECAANRGLRDSSALKELAHDTSLEVHQILLKVRKELESPEASIKPAVRQALVSKIAHLDVDYSVASTFLILRTKLGIRFVASVLKKLSLVVDEAIKEFKTHPQELSLAASALASKIRALVRKAEMRTKDEFRSPRLQQLILADLEKAFSEMTSEESLQALLQQAPKEIES